MPGARKARYGSRTGIEYVKPVERGAENQQPQRRLHHPGQQFGAVMAQLHQFHPGKRPDGHRHPAQPSPAARCAKRTRSHRRLNRHADPIRVAAEDVLESGVRPDRGLEFGRCADRSQRPAIHERHPVAKNVGLLHVVGGQQYGHVELSFIRWTCDHTPSRAIGSKPTVGSSRISSDGRVTSACASSKRRTIPPE